MTPASGSPARAGGGRTNGFVWTSGAGGGGGDETVGGFGGIGGGVEGDPSVMIKGPPDTSGQQSAIVCKNVSDQAEDNLVTCL